MLNLKKFDKSDYANHPSVEDFCGEIVPRLVQVKMTTPDFEGTQATLVIDGNGIQVLVYSADGEQKIFLAGNSTPFPWRFLSPSIWRNLSTRQSSPGLALKDFSEGRNEGARAGCHQFLLVSALAG